MTDNPKNHYLSSFFFVSRKSLVRHIIKENAFLIGHFTLYTFYHLPPPFFVTILFSRSLLLLCQRSKRGMRTFKVVPPFLRFVVGRVFNGNKSHTKGTYFFFDQNPVFFSVGRGIVRRYMGILIFCVLLLRGIK